MTPIELDGATGEGGGQILRSALALSMCTGRPVSLQRIRAGRSKPGLMRQHLTCVQAALQVCGGEAEGAELGSQALVFHPGTVRAGDYTMAVGTAGSCTLVLQTVLPALMQANGESRLQLGGGTHNPMAPPFHFLQRCFAPLLARLGVGLDLSLQRHGFFPAGGGQVTAVVRPPARPLTPVDVCERGNAVASYAEGLAPGIPRSVATRELAALERAFNWSGEQLRTPPVRQDEGPGNALMATLAFEHVTEVVSAFGEKGICAEQVAASVIRDVRRYGANDGALGPHLADQWMLPLALAVVSSGQSAGYTCTEVTEHARTNAGVIAQFLPVRFDIVDGGVDQASHVSVIAV